MGDIFRTGGPHNIQRTGRDTYTMTTSIPTDADSMFGRECPDETCSPGYFKVKPGTGLAGDDYAACICPYCGLRKEPDDFRTKEQTKFLESIVEQEAHRGIDRMAREAFGIGPSGTRRFGNRGDFISFEMSYKPGRLPHIHRPFEEALRRDVTCGHCTLEHAVFGLATWCPDCGRDIFPAHVRAEAESVRRILSDVPSRAERLGSRVAARDTDNALEDTVSIFEGVLRILTRRALLARLSPAEIDQALKKIGNGFQNLARGEELVREHLGVELFDGVDRAVVDPMAVLFEKRHVITHNLGVIDRRFMEKALTAAALGREVLVRPAEVEQALSFVDSVVTSLHERLFPSSTPQ